MLRLGLVIIFESIQDLMSAPAYPLKETAPMQNSGKDIQRRSFLKWGPVILAAFAVLLIPPPRGITPQGWRLLAIFAATIMGSIVRPIPGAAVVMLGVSAAALTGALPVDAALGGYADPIVWMVLAAFFTDASGPPSCWVQNLPCA